MKKEMHIAIAGNPNSGKTTIFNRLCGTRQHVANYPGVTVERKEGRLTHKGCRVRVTDLPGTYGLSSSSPDEMIAVRTLLEERPDIVVNVIDSSNLRRNLHLSIQLLELGLPVLLVLNMSDVADRKGMKIDAAALGAALGIPAVKTTASRGEGVALLKDMICGFGEPDAPRITSDTCYTPQIRRAMDAVAARLPADCPRRQWTALKLLENDACAFLEGDTDTTLMREVESQRAALEKHFGHAAEIVITGQRYAKVQEIIDTSLSHPSHAQGSLGDRLDKVLTNRVLAIPVFMAVMFMVFKLTFAMADPMVGWIEGIFGFAADTLGSVWPEESMGLLRSLIIDGVIAGLGGVLVFVPNIMLLFLAIAVLEDSGYMPRAAFIMDRLMNRLGLNGKSFIPLLVGFGCSVPAIMATRTIESRRDRLTTMLIAPLMSCGARLPIYALLIPAFFPEAWHARMLWIIYMSGIALAVVCAKLLHLTVLKGEHEHFLLELPPYRLPSPAGVITSMWERSMLYLKKAGTILLGVSVLLWIASTFPQKKEFDVDYEAQIEAVQENAAMDAGKREAEVANIENAQAAEALEYTVSGRVGRMVEPILRPLGFDWKIGTALIAGLAAKEVFVAQMGIVYAVGEADESSAALRQTLQKNYSPLQGLCMMFFCLLSAPCVATTAVMRRESNSWFWALFQFFGLTGLAYVVTLLIYQLGILLGY